MNRTVLMSLLLLATAACDDSSEREAAEAARLDWVARAIEDERGRINGLSIGSSEAAVVAVFGQPQRIETGFSEVVTELSRTLFYDGIEIYLIGDEIYNLKCRAPNCVTHDGIRVGDSIESVLAVIGKGIPERREDGTEVLRYPLANADVYLVHKLKGRTVIELELWFDYT